MLRTRILYLVLLIGAVLFYFFYRQNISFITLLVAVLLPLVCLVLLIISCFFVKISLKPAISVCDKKSPIRFGIEVRNKFFLPVPNAKIEIRYVNQYINKKDNKAQFILPVSPFSKEEISCNIASDYCGKITVQLKYIRLYDYLGIFSVTLFSKDSFDVMVIPSGTFIGADIDSSSGAEFETDIYSATKSGDDPSEIFNIREYQNGDKINRIHWKLSSKLSQTLVKEYSLPVMSKILILAELALNPSEKQFPDKLDTLLETVTSLSLFLLEYNITHYIGWYSVKDRHYRKMKISSEDDLSILMNMLLSAKLYSEKGTALFHQEKTDSESRYSHIVYVTSKLDEHGISALSANKQCTRKYRIYYRFRF